MEYALSIVVWAAVPVLAAVGLIGLGIWTIRTSRGDVGRAAGVIVIASGILVTGLALSTVLYSVPVGRTHTVETVSEVIYDAKPPVTPLRRQVEGIQRDVDAASLAATVVNAPDPQAAFDSLTLPEQIGVADALAEGVTVTTVETMTVPRPEGSQRPAIEPESDEEGPVGRTK